MRKSAFMGLYFSGTTLGKLSLLTSELDFVPQPQDLTSRIASYSLECPNGRSSLERNKNSITLTKTAIIPRHATVERLCILQVQDR